MSGGEMFQTVYGPNSDGGPISLEEVITDIIEDEVAKYTNTRLAIEEAGGWTRQSLSNSDGAHYVSPTFPRSARSTGSWPPSRCSGGMTSELGRVSWRVAPNSSHQDGRVPFCMWQACMGAPNATRANPSTPQGHSAV